jgi:hypothetical protein
MNATENFEVWHAGGDFSFLYTEDRDFARELRKEFGRAALYERRGKVFAWQFKIPNHLVNALKARFESQEEKPENSSVDIQRVTVTPETI